MLGPTLADYELFIYALQDDYSTIQSSTLTVIRQASNVPPNIKRNRIPAPDLSFRSPNLPFLIEEITGLLTKIDKN